MSQEKKIQEFEKTFTRMFAHGDGCLLNLLLKPLGFKTEGDDIVSSTGKKYHINIKLVEN